MSAGSILGFSFISLPVKQRDRVDDLNPALPYGPSTMGIMVYLSLWVVQYLYHQP